MRFLQDPIIAGFIIVCLAVMVAALRKKRREDVLLLAVVIMLFGLPRAGVLISQVNLPLPLAHILTAALILVWGLRRSRIEHRDKLRNFFILYAVAACWGMGLGVASGGNLIIAFLEVSFYLFSIGLFFYANETFCDKYHFYVFVKILAVVAAMVSLYGVAQYYFGASILLQRITYNSASDKAREYLEYTGSARRVLSSFGDPNVLASQLLLFIGIGIATVTARGILPTKRLIWLTVLILSCACLYFTQSRAAIACSVLVAIIIFFWRTRLAFLILPMVVFGFLLVLVAVGDVPALAGIIPSDDMRLQFAGWAWQFIKGVPLGCGFGNSVIISPTNTSDVFSVVPATNMWMGFNSLWLDLLSRLGLPGILTFGALLITLFRRIWHDSRQVSDPLVAAVIVGALAGCIGQSVIWLANNTYMLPGGGVNFWFTMGMLYAGCRAFTAKPAVMVLPIDGQWPSLTPAMAR